MPTNETLPDGLWSLGNLMAERLGVEPARLRFKNNRHLTEEELRALMQRALREGKVPPGLHVMPAGLLNDPRIQVD